MLANARVWANELIQVGQEFNDQDALEMVCGF
jgi:hypothetical protein